jgi:hypothetical protein
MQGVHALWQEWPGTCNRLVHLPVLRPVFLHKHQQMRSTAVRPLLGHHTGTCPRWGKGLLLQCDVALGGRYTAHHSIHVRLALASSSVTVCWWGFACPQKGCIIVSYRQSVGNVCGPYGPADASASVEMAAATVLDWHVPWMHVPWSDMVSVCRRGVQAALL